MEFIGLKIFGFLVYTFAVGYIGNKWATFNSVSDVETQYKNAVAAAEALKANVQAEIAAAEAKATSLKALV
jgi:hypothetical protein